MAALSDLKICHKTNSGTIITPRGRMWFCSIHEKRKNKFKGEDDPGSYSVTIVFPKEVDLSVLRAAAKECAVNKFGANLPKNLKSPFRKCSEVFSEKGDEKYPPEMAEWVQITAKQNDQMPGIVDRNNVPLNQLREGESAEDVKARLNSECYSGRWARVSLSFWAFDISGSKGVTPFLTNVQLLDHDEAIGRRRARAEEEFASVDGADTDAVFDEDDGL